MPHNSEDLTINQGMAIAPCSATKPSPRPSFDSDLRLFLPFRRQKGNHDGGWAWFPARLEANRSPPNLAGDPVRDIPVRRTPSRECERGSSAREILPGLGRGSAARSPRQPKTTKQTQSRRTPVESSADSRSTSDRAAGGVQTVGWWVSQPLSNGRGSGGWKPIVREPRA